MKSHLPLVLALTLLLPACSKGPTGPVVDGSSEPQQVFIYSVTASPTADEQITLKNNSGAVQDISFWRLGYSGNHTAYTIPNNTFIDQGQTLTYSHATLGFDIQDANEIIYLSDSAKNVVDTWSSY